MKIGVMMLTDGRRSCFERTYRSFRENWTGPEPVGVVVDDSASGEYHKFLLNTVGNFDVLPSTRRKRGFHGAIQAGWDWLLSEHDVDYIFHLEDDFIFNESIQCDAMIEVLGVGDRLAQVALKRQPVNELEFAAGGLVEMWPDLYKEVRHGDLVWTEHDLFFTTNPSVYTAHLATLGWPQVSGSEAKFSNRLRDDGYKFAYWGGKFDPPKVTHIGDVRVGTGY